MKKLTSLPRVVVLISLLVAGCAPAATPTPVVVVVTATPFPAPATPLATPAPALPRPTPPPDAVVEAETLNLRAGPSTDYDVVGQVKKAMPSPSPAGRKRTIGSR